MAHQRTGSQLGDACCTAFLVSGIVKAALSINSRHIVEAKVSSRKAKVYVYIHDSRVGYQNSLLARANVTNEQAEASPMTTAQRWDQAVA